MGKEHKSNGHNEKKPKIEEWYYPILRENKSKNDQYNQRQKVEDEYKKTISAGKNYSWKLNTAKTSSVMALSNDQNNENFSRLEWLVWYHFSNVRNRHEANMTLFTVVS